MKKAIIFGASGFIGTYLLNDLLASADYDQVLVVVRKNIEFKHPRLKVLIGDFNSLPSLKTELIGDDVFISLGTTKKKTSNEKEYYKIDHDYPVLAAKIAKENGAKSVFLVSAVGAAADSKFFYVKAKGETERDILALGYTHTHIFRPSMLLGERQEHRSMEKTLIQFWPVVDSLLVGKLKAYKGITGDDVARAMMNAAKTEAPKAQIYEWSEMKVLANA